MRYSIVIPTFNQIAYTIACLDAITRNTPASLDYEVIVVDNGSTDETRPYLADWRIHDSSRNKVIFLEKNPGFSFASNLGAENARGEFLVLLNNDTEVQEGWLPALHMGLRRPRAGIVGPKLLFPGKRTINHAGYTYHRPAGGFYPIYLNYPEDAESVCYDRRYQAILGACMLMRRDLFLQVGGFGDFGLEDIDLCFKVRQAGFDVWYCHESVVLHHGSVTIKNSESGSLPSMDLDEVNRRWSTEWFREDDEEHYRQDGYSRLVLSQNLIQLTDYREASNELLERAIQRAERGEVGEAITDLKDALNLFPRNKLVIVLLAEFYRCLGEKDLAIVYLEDFMTRDPSFLLGASLLYQLYDSLQLDEKKARLTSALADYFYGIPASLLEEQLRTGGPIDRPA